MRCQSESDGAAPPRRRTLAFVAALAGVAGLCAALVPASSVAAPSAPGAARHDACSAPNSAHVPCRFSTPSGNVRCLWTPHPNNVVCELLATGRGYRLRPTGRATALKPRLRRRGQTLPTDQILVFPDSLSCQDTRTTMTCNQDFGFGRFRISPAGSRGS